MKFFSKISGSKIYKTIFGFDIFISYSRVDSMDYAYSVSQHFLDKGYECYLDQLSSTTPGKELPTSIKNAVTKSSAFILIGSAGAKQSQSIENEIRVFLENNLNKPLIPITINGEINETAIWFNKVVGLAFIKDTTENLKFALPNKKVLERVEGALKFTKKSIRLRQIAISILFTVLLITGISIYYTTIKINDAEARVENSNKLVDEAKIKEKNSQREAFEANVERGIADSLKAIANLEKDTALALKLEAETIAKANSLASSASNLLITDPTKSYLLAKKAISIFKTPEACNSLFMAFISAPFYKSVPCKMAKVFPNGKYIAVINDKGVLEVIDWNGKQIYQKIKIPYGFNVEMTEWNISSDNQSIIVNSKSKLSNCEIYYLSNNTKTDINNKILVNIYKKDPNAIELGISHDGKKYSIYSGGDIIIYEIKEQNITLKNKIKFSTFIPTAALFCLDNNTMILWDTSQIFFLDTKKKKIIDKIENQNGIVEVKLSNKTPLNIEVINYLYFSSKDGDFIQNHLPSMLGTIQKLSRSYQDGNSISSGLSELYFSKDDEDMMFLHYSSNNALIRSTQKLYPDYNLRGGHSSEILCGSFSKNNSLSITGGEDNLAVVWNKETLKYILKGHTKPLKQVFLSDDGIVALTVSYDETAKFWILKMKDFSMYKDASIRFNSKTNSYEYKDNNFWTNTHITPEFIIKNIERPNEQN